MRSDEGDVVVEVGARELDAPDDCAPVVAVLSARVPVVEDADVLEALGDVRAVVELRLFFYRVARGPTP